MCQCCPALLRCPPRRHLEAWTPWRSTKGNQRQWEGIWTTGLPSHQTQFYGPSSSFYFLTRLGSHTGLSLQLPHPDPHLQPNAASRFFASPTSPRKDSVENRPIPLNGSIIGETLSRAQGLLPRTFFLANLSCDYFNHDEHEFREHYEYCHLLPAERLVSHHLSSTSFLPCVSNMVWRLSPGMTQIKRARQRSTAMIRSKACLTLGRPWLAQVS